jgi:hypothetical protein
MHENGIVNLTVVNLVNIWRDRSALYIGPFIAGYRGHPWYRRLRGKYSQFGSVRFFIAVFQYSIKKEALKI